MKQTELRSTLSEKASDLLHEEIWGIVGGAGTGSMVNIYLGKKILRPLPLENSNLSELIQKYDSELYIFLYFAPWRLDDKESVICSSRSDNAKEGEMMNGLNKLLGTSIGRLTLDCPGGNLVLYFENEMRLTIFSNCVDEEKDGLNFALGFPDKIFCMEANGNIVVSERLRPRFR